MRMEGQELGGIRFENLSATDIGKSSKKKKSGQCHKVIEARRRERINGRLNELKLAINSDKGDKYSILTEALSYIATLQEEKARKEENEKQVNQELEEMKLEMERLKQSNPIVTMSASMPYPPLHVATTKDFVAPPQDLPLDNGTIFGYGSIASVIVALDTTVVDLSPLMCSLLKDTRTNMIGQKGVTLVPRIEGVTTPEEQVGAILNGAPNYIMCTYLLDSTGYGTLCQFTTTLIKDSEGNPRFLRVDAIPIDTNAARSAQTTYEFHPQSASSGSEASGSRV